MAKKAATVDDLVAAALRAAASSGGSKLTGKGGLFPKTDGIHGEALRRVRDGDRPLLSVVREAKAGKAITQYVRLTADGVATLVESIPREDVASVVVGYAAKLSTADRERVKIALDGRTSGPSAELFSEAVIALDREAERQATERADASRQSELERYRKSVALKKQTATRLEGELAFCRKEIAGLEAMVADLGTTRQPAEGPKPEKKPLEEKTEHRPPPKPETPEEKDFRRSVAGSLVASWLETYRLNKPDARVFLETAMGNVADLRQVGEEGEELSFDGKYHECDKAVSTGNRVRVVRPGWVLQEGEREHRLVPAKVSP